MTAAAPQPQSADCRCPCGNLLARWVADGVELKCRRCKRVLLVPFPEPLREARPLRPASEPIPIREIG